MVRSGIARRGLRRGEASGVFQGSSQVIHSSLSSLPPKRRETNFGAEKRQENLPQNGNFIFVSPQFSVDAPQR
jgi:hypothetical protein